MARVKSEIIDHLSNDVFSLEATNRGAILRNIYLNKTLITSEVKEEDTKPGTKGGFFAAPIVFSRLVDRVLPFQGKNYLMPYPEDLDADEIDPKQVYIHGIHHYYTWDITKKTKGEIVYELTKDRLPPTYPFPHNSKITYKFEGQDLIIEVGVEVPESTTAVATPAMLTMHPFFKFQLEENSESPQLKADLKNIFEYEKDAEIPFSFNEPTNFENPFSDFKTLPKDLDHSFLAGNTSFIRWPNGLTLKITDETDPKTCPFNPLQVWTTGADTRNAFGVENGGPGNLPWLVANKKVDENLLPVVNPGEYKFRRVRYSLI